MNKWAINTNNIQKDDFVKYARGAKEPLINKNGYVQTIPDEDGLVMVEFVDLGSAYPCHIGNLDHIE
jgi:hypothetical protein